MFTHYVIKKYKKTISFILILISVFALAYSGDYSFNPFTKKDDFGYSAPKKANAFWYDINYQYCRKLTINNGPVATTTTNGFALFFSTTTASLKATSSAGHVAKINSNGVPNDVIYTSGTDCSSDAGSLLDFYHESYASTTGEINSWIEVRDLSSTTDKTILMYYGNQSATDVSNETGTFGALGEIGVYNFRNDPGTAGASGMRDSSPNGNHGTDGGTMTSTDLVTGKVGKAIDFDGTDDHITLGDALDIGSTPRTMLTWAYVTNGSNAEDFFGKWNTSGNNRSYIWGRESTGTLRWQTSSDGAAGTICTDSTASTVPLNTWIHSAVTWKPSTTAGHFVNGVATTTTGSCSQATVYGSTAAGIIAAEATAGGTPNLTGQLDDMRVYNRVLSAADINTIYNNTNSVSTFWSSSREETAPTTLTVSGTLYSDEGTTQITSGKTIAFAVGTSTPTVYSTTTDPGTGAFHVVIPISKIGTNATLVGWVDGDATTRASLVTTVGAAGGVASGYNLYKDHVIARSDLTGTSLGASNFNFYDSRTDADIQFTATTTSAISVRNAQEFYIWSSASFTLGTAELSLDGSFENNAGTFSNASGTLTMTGTSKTIAGTLIGTSALGNVAISGSYTFSNNASTSDLYIAPGGSLIAPAKLTVDNFRQYGTFNSNSGTLFIDGPTNTQANQAVLYAVGRDVQGNAGGSGNATILAMATSSNYLYIVKGGNNTACSQTAGSAVGCELMVFDITTPTSPTYVAGRDVDGSATGANSQAIDSIRIVGSYLYITKGGNATACSQTAGSAIGCELMVFDISSSTNPVYKAGRDADGSAGGANSVEIISLQSVGSYLYTTKTSNATACSQTAGSAAGCELMVFDISSSTNPVYKAGRDADGSAGGTSAVEVTRIRNTGNYLLLGKIGNATACSQTAGSASGCELMIFDISSSTNPVYKAGRDADGSATGATSVNFMRFAINSNYLYAAKAGNATACSQTAGSASGCELMVFDISSSTNPVYKAGRDSDGTADGNNSALNLSGIVQNKQYLYVGRSSATQACSQTNGLMDGCELVVFDVSSTTNPTMILGRDAAAGPGGTAGVNINTLMVNGSYLYVAKAADNTACSQSVGSADGCELLVFSLTNNYQGSVLGKVANTNALATVTVFDFVNFRTDRASTTALTNSTAATLVPPAILSVSGAYANSGTASFSPENYLTFNGTTQSISGTLSGTSRLPNVFFFGSGSKTLGSSASTSDVTIASGVTVVAPTVLTIDGDFTNNGTFTNSSGLVEMKSYINDFLAGRDVSGSAGGTGSLDVTGIAASGNYVYITKPSDATACSQTAGSAIGCELMVFDVSSSTNPVYVAGRDSAGSATGNSGLGANAVAISGNYLFMVKNGSATACSQTAGSAIGCELMVFDISSSTNPVYKAGRDASGSAAGTASVVVNKVSVSGSVLAISKAGNATACSQTAGSAIGCELMVFDISSSTNPVYVAGRDADGSTTGANSVTANSVVVANSFIYFSKVGNATACSQSAGSAVGCELMMFDVSSTTNPVYKAGRDTTGSATGVGTIGINDMTVKGSNYLYVVKASSATACSQTVGSATGCELMVFDISSTTNPIYKAGRDASGSSNGTAALASNSLVISGNSLFIGRNENNTICSQTTGSAIGCELVVFDISSTTNPTYKAGTDRSGIVGDNGGNGINILALSTNRLFVGTIPSAAGCSQQLGSLIGCELMIYDLYAQLDGSFTGTKKLYDLTIGARTKFGADTTIERNIVNSDIVNFGPRTINIGGNYTNGGTLTASTSEVIFSGTAAQTATGTMTGTSAFYKLGITNTVGLGASSQSVTFGGPLTVSDTLRMVASTSAKFAAGQTVTAQNLDLQGTSLSSVWLRSSSNGSVWYLDADGTKTVRRVNVRDSNATASTGGITDANGTDATGNTNWTFTTVTVGTTTLAEHAAGQSVNAFSYQNKTSEPLYAFKMTPGTESVTVTDLVFTLSGIKKVNSSDFANIKLYRDMDNDGNYDATDVQVSGTGVMSISGQSGTITFTTDFTATTSRNYILVADWNSPSNGSFMRVELPSSGLVATGVSSLESITVNGSVSSVQHYRNNKGGGSGSGAIGGDAPAGAGQQGGGGSGGGSDVDTNNGGQTIGNSAGFFWPSAHVGSWSNGGNAYDQSDGTYASTNSANTASYSNHGFSIPSSDAITGIETKLEISGTTGAGSIDVQLSWDGGSSWTSAKTTPTLTTTDTVVTLGSPSDTWGRTWSSSNFSNANFVVRLTGAPSSNTVQVDAIQTRIYHQATGGGGGGGGEI